MSEEKKATKHFNSGCVFGRIMEEPKKEVSKGNEDYISFKVSCSGPKSGQITAYCRLWTAERTVPFLSQYRKNPAAVFFLKGFYGQFKTEKNEFMSNFTVFQWEERDKVDPRAVFILRGVVDQAQPLTDGSQRLLFTVHRDGQPEELFELFSPAELLLDRAEAGQFLEVKGYVRQQNTEDEFGGASGPIRAYIQELKVL
jgi:hypothetical protein